MSYADEDDEPFDERELPDKSDTGDSEDDNEDEGGDICPNCGKEVYHDSAICPHCGEAMTPLIAGSSWTRSWWVWVIIIVCLLTML